MKNLTLFLCLLLAMAHALRAELRVPAYTAYIEPDPNGASVSRERGVTAWTEKGSSIMWYGQFKNTGKVTAVVALRLPKGNSLRLRLIAGNDEHEATAVGADGEVRAVLGEFAIETPGYVRFELQPLDPSQETRGEISALILEGEITRDALFNPDPRRNAASVHLFYPLERDAPVAGFYNEVTAVEDPVATYYMACGFARGYFGMQVNSPAERRIIFSVWDAASGQTARDRSTVARENQVQLLSKGEGVHASAFGNEGTGGHSHLVYNWKTGSRQRFFVTAKPAGADTIYSGWWFHPDHNRWMLIASFRAPKDGGWLRGLYSFSENFGGSTGHYLRKALFGPQWIQLSDGKWRELTEATFSHDPTGKANRLDRFMGVEDGRFFLSHGGFIEGFTKYGEKFTRPVTGTPPAIELPGEPDKDQLAGAPEFHDVFKSGLEGFASIRIPSVIVTKQGSVLAFAEGRVRASDQAENKIVVKRSTDGGRTWDSLRVLHDDGANSLNNPTAVVEQDSGRVFLMYQRIPSHLKETSKDIATGLEGSNIYRNFLLTSDDDGASWSTPLDVTLTTKRPERATTIASGPGIGIQLTRGPQKGRLIIPFNEGPFGLWQNFAVFSDDDGRTWKYGADVPGALIPDAAPGARSQINEAQMVEMSDGSVRLDSRQFAGAKVRKTSVSRDGGATWSPVADIATLRDPSCMGGVLRYSFDDGTGNGKILHTGPDSTRRDHGTVYLSVDDGASFPVKRELHPGGFAYSVPTRLPDGTIGVLFEADNYKRITFARFSIDWLTKGVNYSTLPESRSERSGKFAGWMARHEQKVQEVKSSKAQLVFLGDSITQNWETVGKEAWQNHFASHGALNLGFGGDSTQHVLWRLEHGEFDGLHPKVCVLLIGTNNARHSESPPRHIAVGISAIIGRIQAKSPDTKILLHAIFPRGANADDPWRKRCDEINQLLPPLADGRSVHFIDLKENLANPNGTISKAVMPDLLHLSAKGYEIWADAIEARVAELMK